MHIAVAGNMGSGKTTLTTLLAEHYGWTPFFEQVDDNPYLDDYYKDIPRWSFNMEVFFLRHRFKDLMRIQDDGVTYIQDRSIYEGVYVFTANNWRMGNLSDRDYQTYMELFELMMSLVNLPDLMIYIRSTVPNLIAQIAKRGRDYEQSIRIDYLQGLNKRYEDWIAGYKGKLLIIDGDTCKFGENPSDFEQVTDRIDSLLYGLFPFDESLSTEPSSLVDEPMLNDE